MFGDVVALYRALNRPSLTQGYSYTFEGVLDARTSQLAEHCEHLGGAFGSVDVFDEGNGRFRIDVQLPTNDQGRVFHNVTDLLQHSPKLAFGVLPENFYIAELDYCSLDADKPEPMMKLDKLAQFIRLLSKLADDKVDFGSKVNRLLFILPTDATKVRKTALAEIRVEEKALAFDLNHLSLLESLVSEGNANKLHLEERQLIMRSAIADSLAAAEHSSNDLTFLCEHWPDIRRRYLVNFQAYIQNFAFEDVRKKIVDSELEYASKLTGAFGDIAGKLLALPVSIAGVVALDKLDTNPEFIAGCVGLCLVTVVLIAVLQNVRHQIDRLQSGYDYVFGPVLGKAKTYPTKLRGELEKREKSLAKQARLTRRSFRFFMFLALLPALAAAWKAWARYPEIEASIRAVSAFVWMVIGNIASRPH
ncbi:hypothetical protein KDW49_06865 [Burkholderia dolosa]|uniref:hypothetical protein n=2 Tax=Burkholderia cepacia complex TaxID=87882 RepID=UPI001B9F5BFD|nr:hypothetical protein [Burkholderia dolosa]MBR8300433.1 hypothetical protein [Burkholderia dolosa]